MTKIYVCLAINLLGGLCTYAQKLTVSSFTQRMDPMTVPMQQKDENGEICALLKVQIPLKGCRFEGSVIKANFEVSEYWVYMSPGAKQLNVKCPNKNTCVVAFDKYGIAGLRSKGIYVLEFNGLDDNRNVQTENVDEVRSSQNSLEQMRKIVDNVVKIGAYRIMPFFNGIAPVKKGNKYAFIDKDGKQLTAFAFDECFKGGNDNKNGWEVRKKGQCGVLNAQGKLTIDCVYKYVSMGKGLAACSKNIKMHASGVVMFDEISKARYDVAEIETGNVLKRNVTYEVASGMIMDYEYPRQKSYNEFVKKDGSKAFSQNFQSVHRFSEGMACVYTKQDGWFVIDQNGDKIFSLPNGARPYDYSNYSDGCFHEGLLAIEIGRKVGYMDKYGEIVIPAKYSEGCSFSDGYAAVGCGHISSLIIPDQWCYIDKNGNVMMTLKDGMFSCGKFKNGIAIGEIREDVGYKQVMYDKKGNVLLSGYELSGLVWYGKDCFRYNLYPVVKKNVRPGRKVVYVNENYEEVGEEYSDAGKFSDEFTSVTSNDGRNGIIDRYGNVVWIGVDGEK